MVKTNRFEIFFRLSAEMQYPAADFTNRFSSVVNSKHCRYSVFVASFSSFLMKLRDSKIHLYLSSLPKMLGKRSISHFSHVIEVQLWKKMLHIFHLLVINEAASKYCKILLGDRQPFKLAKTQTLFLVIQFLLFKHGKNRQ